MTDYLIRVIAKEAGVRGLACLTTAAAQEAARRHQTSSVAGVALGRVLTGAALLGALLKVQQRVALKFEGNGPLQKVLAEADSYGRVRGYIAVPELDWPPVEGQFDLENAIGRAGLLTVVKDLRLKQLVESVTPLATSDVSGDLQAYFEQSEQIPTAVQVGEVIDEASHILLVGGLLLQEMPGKEQAGILNRLQDRLQELPPVVDLYQQGQSPETVLALVLAGVEYEVLEQRPLRFQCDCSRERTRQVLSSLGVADIANLLETEGEAEVNCHYCRQTYRFDEADLELLLSELQARP